MEPCLAKNLILGCGQPEKMNEWRMYWLANHLVCMYVSDIPVKEIVLIDNGKVDNQLCIKWEKQYLFWLLGCNCETFPVLVWVFIPPSRIEKLFIVFII